MKDRLIELIYTFKEDEALALVREMLDQGHDPHDILDACGKAMAVVGERFEDGRYFMPELILSGEILAQIAELVKPGLAGETQAGPAKKGTVVLGTVEGDIHDIGKNIVAFMLDVNGFQVHDLGIDVPVETFVKKAKEVKPDILGLSGFLTLAFDQMKQTVEAVSQAGAREGLKIMIGGCQMSDSVVEYVGADAFRPDAMAAVKLAKEWMGVN